MPDMLDPYRECATDRRACPFGTMRDDDRRLSIHGSRHHPPGGDTAHDAPRIRARTPPHPPKSDFEAHWKSVARTLDERMPARIAGGPSYVIQAVKGAMQSPDLKHALPDLRR
ncbi:hypothetical protein LGM42_25350 [Burkholderia sp. AU39826]|uniref:hypothetical protein n=1 Tax=Burkholderia sp. AU39826 TaxID=2879634 RepID=UPI001CF5D63E|nr:hypothetical protein [Burkholderia sp. AU39826]MCA7973198.1 hypothetical protein [Burkholderia sp. AU39826]